MIRKDIKCDNCLKEFILIVDDDDKDDGLACPFCKDDIINLDFEEE